MSTLHNLNSNVLFVQQDTLVQSTLNKCLDNLAETKKTEDEIAQLQSKLRGLHNRLNVDLLPLVNNYEGIAIRVAKSLCPFCTPRQSDAVIATAKSGMFDAILRLTKVFTPSQITHTLFSQYLFNTYKYRILDYIMQQDLISLPKEKHRILRAYVRIKQDNPDLGDTEIYTTLNEQRKSTDTISLTAFNDTIDYINKCTTVSYSQNADPAEDDLIYNLPDHDPITTYPQDIQDAVRDIVLTTKSLTQLQRKVLTQSFGLNGTTPMPLSDIARSLGIKTDAVQRIRDEALKIVKSILEEETL